MTNWTDEAIENAKRKNPDLAIRNPETPAGVQDLADLLGIPSFTPTASSSSTSLKPLKIAPQSTRKGIEARTGNKPQISILEADWQKTLIDLLHVYGYKVCVFRKALRKAKKSEMGDYVYRTPFGADGVGFPDLFAARPGRHLFIECKSEIGKISREQNEWWSLIQLSHGEYYLARPQDYDFLVEALR